MCTAHVNELCWILNSLGTICFRHNNRIISSQFQTGFSGGFAVLCRQTLSRWRADVHTKLLNLLSGSADEYEWWCEYGWGEILIMMMCPPPIPHQLVMWGHWVEPINHCIAIQMFGRQLFVLRVVLFKWAQISRDCWPSLCCCLSLRVGILLWFAYTALECQNVSHNTARSKMFNSSDVFFFFLSLKWITREFVDFNSEMEDDWHKSWWWGQRSPQSSIVWGSRPSHVLLIINKLKAIWPDDLLYMCTDCFLLFDMILLRNAKPLGAPLGVLFALPFTYASALPRASPCPAMSPETWRVERITPSVGRGQRRSRNREVNQLC